MKSQCPGMNKASWKIEDIAEYECPACKHKIEFWKDDVKFVCPGCGKASFNPRLAHCCLAWCGRAEECIGNMDITEWKKKMAQLHAKKEAEADCGPSGAS